MSDLSLGPCCVCSSMKRVRSILCLNLRSPIPGHGWGCVVCGLPSDGASAVICDACCESHREGDVTKAIRFACRGYPGSEGRIPIGELTEFFGHDVSKHPEAPS